MYKEQVSSSGCSEGGAEETMLWPKIETSATLKPTLSLPKLFAPEMLRVPGPDDSLESNTDERTKLHIHLCMCSIVCHVHSLNCLQGGKVWLLLGSHSSNTARCCPPWSSHPH